MQQITLDLELSDIDMRTRVAHLFAFLFIMSMLIPQCAKTWRPPYILVFLGLWFVLSIGPKMTETFKRIGPLLLLLAAQCSVIFTKYLIHKDPQIILGRYLNGYFFLFVATFLCGHYLLHYPETLRRIRVWGVIFLAVATAWALPIILSHPGIGRLTVSSDHPRELFAQGIPGYPLLYTIPVVFMLLCSYLERLRGPMRYVYMSALILLVIHVLLSTFTLATLLMVTALSGGVIGEAYEFLRRKQSDRKYRARILAIALISVVLVIVLSKVVDTKAKHLKWSGNKATRLMTGMVSSGLEEGDETGRGKRMIKSFKSFCDHPLLGCEFKQSILEKSIGRHSDIADPLALYGILGYMPMIIFHVIIIRCGVRTWFHNRNTLVGMGELAAWIFYGIICFWNTATLTVLPTALLFMQFTAPPTETTSENLSDARSLDN